MTATLLIGLGISLLINLLLFVIAYGWKTDKLTDASYALTFVALALWAVLRAPAITGYNRFLLVMIAAWAARLGGFLIVRVLRAGRDKRFDGRRENFRKFGSFWLAQAITVWIVMLAASQALARDGAFQIWALIGSIVWLLGMVLETEADYQKLIFRNDPRNKGRWIDSGLWRYSRHPNYFGEIVIWIGVYIYALNSLTGAGIVIGLLSPLTIAGLLIWVSGIPPLEKLADEHWGTVKNYQTYKRRTSILIPRPPVK